MGDCSCTNSSYILFCYEYNHLSANCYAVLSSLQYLSLCILHTDINECDINNGNCDQICTNTPGSRVCSCRAGFRLASDGTTCLGGL